MAAHYSLFQRSFEFGYNLQGLKREKNGWSCSTTEQRALKKRNKRNGLKFGYETEWGQKDDFVFIYLLDTD